MAYSAEFTELEILAFDRIAFAHSLIASNYSYRLHNQGYGIYGKTPPCGGVLEIGFVEQNPLVFTGEFGEILAEENSIFIIPPNCDLSVVAKNEGIHRHTSAEFLISCHLRRVNYCPAPEGRTVAFPMLIPPSPENRDVFHLIRGIACAKTAQLERTYFEECADFMQLVHALCERVQATSGNDSISPGNRRHCHRAKAYIGQNISKNLNVGDVAAAIGVSKNYLTNVFSRSEGIPLMEYVNRRKLSYMVELIRRYNYTLSEAGEHVGFTDVNYISRIFKRYYGMTVTEYKRSLEYQEEDTK